VRRVGIVGAGIIGLACACFLAEEGHQVTMLDRDPEGDKCSWGNAGGIAASEILPASVPGVLWRVPRWLADPLGPLALWPPHAVRMLPWLRHFLASGRRGRVEAIAGALAALNARVYDDLVPLLDAAGLNGALHRAGALTVYATEAGFRRDTAERTVKRRHGFACVELTGEEARGMEPALAPTIRRGVFEPAWSHVSDPKRIWAGLLALARARGAMVERRDVTDLPAECRGFDALVVASGAWSARLAATLGDRALLESERGYNTTLPAPGVSLSREVIFAEHKFVATPLEIGLRVGGAAEFAGLVRAPNHARSRALLALARRFLPGLCEQGSTAWMGHRPATPDSLPVIGPSPRRPSVFYAFGHGHLGLTQAATTGRLIAALVAGRTPAVDLAPFSIARFGSNA